MMDKTTPVHNMDPSVANSSKSQFLPFESCQPSLPAFLLLIIAYAVVMLVGLLGNLCLIIIIKKQKESQNVTNVLIANLSISDIFICVMCIPFTVAYTWMDYWVFGEAMCKITAFVQSMSVSVSTFSLVLIAVERHQLIVNPRGWKPNVSHAFWGIVFIWAFSLIISTPFLIFYQVSDDPLKNLSSHSESYTNKTVCIEMWPSIEVQLGFTTTMLVFQYFFPLGFIFICYLKIFVCLQKRYSKVDKIRENGNRLNENRRINIMLISIVVTFGACWLPLNIFNIVFDWNYETLMHCHHNVVFTLCHLVAMISTCVNPIFYGFLNKNFQKDMIILLHNFRCFESQELYENIALSTLNTDMSKGSLKLSSMPANI
ncbi:neuropeptide Y receptor type 6-like isoform 1-T2 [Liasis olivaceus]